MTDILIASGNSHKHAELARLRETFAPSLPLRFRTPAACGATMPAPDPDENGSTYLENATIKARAFHEWSGLPALADDSGVEADFLDGAPGLHSARYAGESVAFSDNIAKLLRELSEVADDQRGGRFVCALVLVADGEVVFSCEESCEGIILPEIRGADGFGYDPIFRPHDGDGRSFGEMTDEEKDHLSHRGRAFRTFAQQFPELTVPGGPHPR